MKDRVIKDLTETEFIGVMENVIDCSSAGSSCYTEDQAREVIQIAREKYGLTVPEKKDLGEVRGWANSVSIVKLSEKYNFNSCPFCNAEFKFNDKYGMYYCETCRYGGGLQKFAFMISKLKSKAGEQHGRKR